MKKILLIVAASLVVVGLAVFAGAMLTSGFDFAGFDDTEMQTKTYTISDPFDAIEIMTKETDVKIRPSLDGICTVVCEEKEIMAHSVTVDDGTLEIRVHNERKIPRFSLFSRSGSIVISLPKAEYEALHIECGTGDVSVADLRLKQAEVAVTTGDVDLQSLDVKESLNVTVTTGDIVLADVGCKEFITAGTTGNLVMKHAIASDRILIARSTGDVTFDRCDAPEIKADLSTGSVVGTLLGGKTFHVKTSTGTIRVPDSVQGGICEIKTSTGDIRISIADE